jgi:hypothetical protein
VTPPLWITDWSDSEQVDFDAARAESGVDARVLRAGPLGETTGRRHHRLRSWPTYAWLAASGVRRARGAPIVAWQPLAGALVGAMPAARRPPLVVLNPLLDPDGVGTKQRLIARGVARADRVVVYSRRATDTAVALGIAPERVVPVLLGVRADATEPAPPSGPTYVLATGRDGRDWETLADATRGIAIDVRVIGPPSLPPGARHLRLLAGVDRREFRALVAGATAIVVPLARPDRPSGQLAILDAMAAGRAVVATAGIATEDYVSPHTGRLVPRQNPGALRAAIEAVVEPALAASLGRAAWRAARGPFSLARFVAEVDTVARSLATQVAA